MFLSGGFTATGSGGDGAVRLLGAHIGGSSTAPGRACATTPAPPWTPTACRSARPCSCAAGSPPPAAASDGAVRLLGAHIGGQLDCTGATLRNDSGPALVADSLQVGQDMFLRGGFTATGTGELGAVRLLGAHIGGQLDCTGADLRNDSGPALVADSLQVGQDMYLSGGFTATGGGAVWRSI